MMLNSKMICSASAATLMQFLDIFVVCQADNGFHLCSKLKVLENKCGKKEGKR
jgi:hypothetical protein